MAPRKPARKAVDPFAALAAEGPRPVYALDGVPVLVEEFLQAVRTAVFPPGATGMDFNFEQKTGPETNMVAVLDAAQTFPAFAPRRLVVVTQANVLVEPRGRSERAKDEADKAADQLLAYLERPSETTTLVLVAQEKWDGRLRPYKGLKKAGAAVRFEAPKEREMPKLLQARAQAMEIRIEPDAARALAQVVGTDLGAGVKHLEQLWLYVGPDRGVAIQRADVDAVITDVREENVFALMDAIASGSGASALHGLHNIFTQTREKRDATAFRTLGLLARQYRNLLATRSALDGGARRGDLASLIGVPPFAADKLADLAMTGPGDRFARALTSLAAVDRAFKGGSLDRQRTMERLVLALQRDEVLIPPETRLERDPR